ncbi:MAG: helix-turn-helix domain-containing protein [Bacilli bacterium]|nr:helix-turn-helix domain-containing protein [Bacilli bacterium]
MNERIKQIRKEAGMNQTEFANALDLSKGFVCYLEVGNRVPSDRTINDICKLFHINENWLRTGQGEMYVDRTQNQIIADFMNQVMESDENDLRRRLIDALAKLDTDQWILLGEIADKLFNENKGTEE